MNHEPSSYKAVITLTYQQMWAIYKSMSAQIAQWILQGKFDEKQEQIFRLTEIQSLLDSHITLAVKQWEDKVVKTETQYLEQDITRLLK